MVGSGNWVVPAGLWVAWLFTSLFSMGGGYFRVGGLYVARFIVVKVELMLDLV